MGKDSNDSGKGSSDYGRGVSQERLSQHSGPEHAYGGYEKVQRDDGSFRMYPSE